MTMGLRTMLQQKNSHQVEGGGGDNSDLPVKIQPIDSETTVPTVPEQGKSASATEVELGKTAQHILKYPIAKSAVDNITSYNYPRAVSPYMMQLKETAPVKPVFTAVDNFNNEILDQVDQMVPQLQTLQPADVTHYIQQPIESVRKQSTDLAHATEDIVNTRVISPSRKVVADFRERYSSYLVDNNGRAIIRGQADPLVKPLNDRLQQFIDAHLADGDSVPYDGFSNELSRSPRILANGVARTIPLIRSSPTELRKLFDEQKAKQPETYVGTLRATLATGSALNSRLWNGITGIFGSSSSSSTTNTTAPATK